MDGFERDGNILARAGDVSWRRSLLTYSFVIS